MFPEICEKTSKKKSPNLFKSVYSRENGASKVIYFTFTEKLRITLYICKNPFRYPVHKRQMTPEQPFIGLGVDVLPVMLCVQRQWPE